MVSLPKKQGDRIRLYLAVIAIGVIILYLGNYFNVFSLVSIGGSVSHILTVNGKQYKYVIYSGDEYYIKEGCHSTICGDRINACEFRAWGRWRRKLHQIGDGITDPLCLIGSPRP